MCVAYIYMCVAVYKQSPVEDTDILFSLSPLSFSTTLRQGFSLNLEQSQQAASHSNPSVPTR